MKRKISINIRKIISLILTIAIVMGSNVMWDFENVYADDDPPAPTTVTFTDANFIKFLSIYYPTDFSSIMETGGTVDASTVASIESLDITFDSEKGLSRDDFDAMNLSEFSKFAGLKSLKFSGCKFSSTPDITGCTGLQELVFTNNTYKDSVSREITGLNSVTTLKYANFEGSAITSITITGSDTTDGLGFSAKNCTGLNSLKISGCTLSETPDITGCTGLQELEFKSNTYKDSENAVIKGLDSIKTLKKADFEGSAIKSITITGSDTTEGLVFSAKNCSSLTSLAISNCKIPSSAGSPPASDPNITGCSSLKEFEFTDNTYTNENNAQITGLNTINTLDRAIFDGSNIGEISFPDSVSSSGLIFTAIGCTNLDPLYFGGYKLINGYDEEGIQYAPSIKRCTSLESVVINGIADQETQTLDISGCRVLSTVSLSYDFTSETNKLIINADNIREESGTSFTVYRYYNGVDKNSDNGIKNFQLIAITSSYIANAVKNNNNYKNMFEELDNEYTGKAEFVVFEQDKSKFEKMKLWLDSNSTYRRDYDSNPVNLRVGNHIDDNRVFLYTKNGSLLDASQYTLSWTITNKTVPTGSGADYKIIERDDTAGMNKITAEKPGTAELEVYVSGDGTSKSAKQVINVYSPIDSLSFASDVEPYTSEASERTIEESGVYDFCSIMKVKEPTLVTASAGGVMGDVTWKIQKKNGDSWEDYTIATGSGLSISNKEITAIPVNDANPAAGNNVKKLSQLTVGYNADEGEYRVTGTLMDNYDDSNYFIHTTAADNTTQTYYYLKIIAARATAGEIGYGYDTPGCPYEAKVPMAKETTIKPPSSMESGYTVTAAFKDDDVKHYSEYLNLVQSAENTNYYKLSFNTTKTNREIAEFLYSLGSDFSATVVLTVTNNSEASDVKTYNKKIGLTGYFTVSYDLNGGTLENENYEYYYIPTSTSNEGNLNLNSPVKAGDTFDGWYRKDTNEKVTKLSNGAALGNLELKAKWRSENPSNNNNENSNTNNSESNSNSESGSSETNSGGGSNGSSTTSSTQSAAEKVLPTYTPAEKKEVFSTTVVNGKGESKEVALLYDGTVTEKTNVPVAATTLNNPANINAAAPTVITEVSVVINETSFADNAKIENITVEVSAKTINGVVGLTPSMVSELKRIAAIKAGTKTWNSNIDIKVNTIAADGKPLSVCVSSDSLKNKALLKVFARDPITGKYIMLNLPAIRYSASLGLVTNGLVSGLEYHYVSETEAKRIEKEIYDSLKVSDAFANTVSVKPGSFVDLNSAISTDIHFANIGSKEYSVSGNQGVLYPETGLYVINPNAKKGIINVSIKVTLTNGKKKTLKTKLKID